MSERQKHLDSFLLELGKEINKSFNEEWKRVPRSGPVADRAVALDLMAAKWQALASGLGALAERTSELAGDLLDGDAD